MRSESAGYNKEVVKVCENEDWKFTITDDQTGDLMTKIETLQPEAWKEDKENPEIAYAEGVSFFGKKRTRGKQDWSMFVL